MDKKEALAKYLGISEDEIKEGYSDNIFEIEDGEEYFVGDYDESYRAAADDIENFIDELGIESFTENFKEWIYDNAVEADWFDEAKDESNRFYAQDIVEEDSDEYENRLIEEADERGILDNEELVEGEDGKMRLSDKVDLDDVIDRFVEDMNNDYEDSVSWFRDNFGRDELSRTVNEHNLVDIDKVIEEAIDWDGIAHFVARYDGDEIELEDGLFAYRTN